MPLCLDDFKSDEKGKLQPQKSANNAFVNEQPCMQMLKTAYNVYTLSVSKHNDFNKCIFLNFLIFQKLANFKFRRGASKSVTQRYRKNESL